MKKSGQRIAALGDAVLMASALAAAPAQASNPPCYSNNDGSLNCGNYAPTTLVNQPKLPDSDVRPVDVLRSNPSWFKCYVRGEKHSGGNNVWYYTYGDDTGRWGYIPAARVFTPQDPYPGVKRC